MMAEHTVSDTSHEGYDTVTLSSPDEVTASFAPGLGMVGCSLQHAGEELLGQRGGLAAYAEHGVTMGIPLLAPWANRLDAFGYTVANTNVSFDAANPLLHLDSNGLPIHGILAASPGWTVVSRQGDENGASLNAELDFGAYAEYLEIFPFPHTLSLAVTLAHKTLDLSVTLTATGDVDVPVAFGFHPCLRLPGIPRHAWDVHLAVRRRVILDDRGLPTQEVELVDHLDGPLGDRELDDFFDDLGGGRTFYVRGGGRRIDVHFGEHFRYAQVYAPGDDEVIAIEPMTASVNPFHSGWPLQMVAPGEDLTAAFRITVRHDGGNRHTFV